MLMYVIEAVISALNHKSLTGTSVIRSNNDSAMSIFDLITDVPVSALRMLVDK